MTCYNGDKYLSKALHSVISQTYSNWELIFWDNQSTDNSKSVLNSFKDKRLKYFYSPKFTNISSAKNYAIKKVKGSLVAFLDVDDWWHKDKLKKQIKLFHDSNVVITATNFWIYSHKKNNYWKFNKKNIKTKKILDSQLKDYRIGLLSIMIRRSALSDMNRIMNPNYHIIGDFDLVIRLIANYKFDYIHEPLAYYRLHSNNETNKRRKNQADELNRWISDISVEDKIIKNKNFKFIKNKINYILAMDRILSSDKKNSYEFLGKMFMSYSKFKVLTALILPNLIIKKLKN